MDNNMKMIYAVIVIAIVVAVGYYLWSKKKSSTATNTATTTSSYTNMGESDAFDMDDIRQVYTSPIASPAPAYKDLGTIFNIKNKNKKHNLGKNDLTLKFVEPIESMGLQFTGKFDNLSLTFVNEREEEFMKCYRDGSSLVSDSRVVLSSVFKPNQNKSMLHLTINGGHIIVNKNLILFNGNDNVKAIKMHSDNKIEDLLVTKLDARGG